VNPTTGVVTFTGVAGFVGFVGTSTLDYVVTDSSGQKASSEVSFTTVAPPVARPDQVAGPKDEVLTLNLLANDSPSSPATLVGSSVKLCGVSPVETAPNCTKTSITVAGEGTYAVNPTTGVVTFTGIGPSYTYSGTRVFDYVVSDSFGQTSSSTATFIALPPPATRAVLDSLSVAYNTTASFSGANAPLANDSAGTIPAAYTTPGTVALDTSSLKLCGATESQITGGGASTGCTETSITTPGEGIWSLDTSTGVVTFDPLPTFYGVATPVPYAVCNTVSGSWQPATPTATCAAATLNVTVAAPPAPSGVADSTTVPFGQSATLTPLGNDTATGASAGSLKLCSVSPAETAPNCFSTVVTVPNEGTWTLNPSTGVVTFVPLASFAGVATPVSYVGADVVGQVFSSVLNVTITPPGTQTPAPAPPAPVVPVATVPTPVTPVMPLPSNPVVPVTTSPPLDVVKPSATKAKKPTLPATGASGLLAMGLLGLGLLFIGIETKRRNRLRNL
jgi:CshA-type fibril repeat protein